VTNDRLSVEAFGRALIDTGDLDPVYIALAKVEWTEEQRKRFLVSYWLFYHPGAACWMAQQSSFWDGALSAARNMETFPSPLGDRWPRASERRHFRGDKAVSAVHELARRFGAAHELVDFVADAAPAYPQLFNRVCSLPQFGPWMAFKVADMLERVLCVPVDFDLNSVTMFDDPKKAALMVWRDKLGFGETAKPKDPDKAIQDVVSHLIYAFRDLSAPPSYDRAIGYQEVETVLCKWKSHVNGHYPVGKDCREIREGLEAWAKVSPAAAEFLHWMPLGEATAEASAAA
jgi:hypothetical protein